MVARGHMMYSGSKFSPPPASVYTGVKRKGTWLGYNPGPIWARAKPICWNNLYDVFHSRCIYTMDVFHIRLI